MNTQDISNLSFEAAFEALDHIVAQLESGDLSLEDSVTLYERGRLLSAHCQTLLDRAELRVSQLNDSSTLNAL